MLKNGLEMSKELELLKGLNLELILKIKNVIKRILRKDNNKKKLIQGELNLIDQVKKLNNNNFDLFS